MCPATGWRVGSVQTFEQHSDIRDAVMSLTSLCRSEGKPPLGQVSACSTEKDFPQAHSLGTFAGNQPYLRAMASWKAALWSEKPCSLIGRVVSQLEAPFSAAKSTARLRLWGREEWREEEEEIKCSRLCFEILDLASN